jgi:tetratricopeptide (TPR) repeat protein
MVLNNWGLTAQYEGDWEMAVDRWTRTREIRTRMGDPWFVALATNNIGEIYSDQGRFEEAAPCFREAIRVWRAVGDEAFAAMALGNQARLLYRTGHPTEAITVLEGVIETFRSLGTRSLQIETEARLAEALLFVRRGPEALEVATRTLQGPEAREVLQAPLLLRAAGTRTSRWATRRRPAGRSARPRDRTPDGDALRDRPECSGDR